MKEPPFPDERAQGFPEKIFQALPQPKGILGVSLAEKRGPTQPNLRVPKRVVGGRGATEPGGLL